MKKITGIVLAITVLGSSCMFDDHKVKGNGNVTTQSKTIGEINGVELHSSFDVILTEGSPSNVKIEAEENVIQYIDLHVENGVLNIRYEDNVSVRTKKQVKIYVTAPSFNRVENSGSGDITGDTKISNDSKVNIDVSGSGNVKLDIDAPEVDATLTGSGEIKLKGETKKFHGEVTGSGDIRAMELLAEEATVQVTGSGGIDIYSSVKVNASITGSGDIRYKGDAHVVSISKTGSGDLKKVD
ncbi:MAG TPA: head GIN domain-containing protein [Niastella sp.]|nr:head GIN domain-containing protein [Niastella sp.]